MTEILPEGWSYAKVQSVCEIVSSGGTPIAAEYRLLPKQWRKMVQVPGTSRLGAV